MITPESIPLGLYIHLPWCLKKCPYCDFNSHEATDTPFERYVDALLADLDAEQLGADARHVETVFIGGGTPSLFPGQAVRRLLDGIRARVTFADDAEVTLEANPGAADAARFEAFLAAGVNRLSVGVQSFNDARLRAIGRVHDTQQALAAITAARDAGCARINIDLMHGLPGSAPEEALADLRLAIELEPEHISWYELALEPGTAFARKPPPLPDDDTIAAETEAGIGLLAAAGFDRYEVSAYARPGEQSRHNLNYWTFGDYLGLGAGAHGKLTRREGVFRTTRRRSPVSYMAQAGTPAARDVSGPALSADLVMEFALNVMRLRHGYRETLFGERTGLPSSLLDEPYARAVANGWLERAAGSVRPTAFGYRFLNDLQSLFLVS
ncbi:MAG: radical SAM family heme chaperone HemW [Gammaproteobacteria bacterium]|jgi:oxygen-independent coproporphyrinogen-3 oxidase